MSFEERCKDAGDKIMKGSLREPPDVSQVSTKSYNILSKINKLGLLTFDSQEGCKNERSYVAGYMLRDNALKFVDILNCRTDKIAIVLHPSGTWERSRIALTKTSDNVVESSLHVFMNRKGHLGLRQSLGLLMSWDVVLLECIDPKWGRKAYGLNGLFTQVAEHLSSIKHTS